MEEQEVEEIFELTCFTCGYSGDSETFIDIYDADFSNVRSGTVHWTPADGKSLLSCPDCGSFEVTGRP